MRPPRKFRSLLTLLIALSVLSLAAVGTLMVTVGNRSLQGFQRYVEESEAQETSGAADMLAADVMTLQTLLYRLLSDDELLQMKLYIAEGMLNTSYEQSVKNIWAQVRSIQSSLDLSVTLSIYLPEYRWEIVINNSSTYDAQTEEWLSAVLARERRDVFVENGQLYFTISNAVGVGEYKASGLAAAYSQQFAIDRYLRRFEPEGNDSIFLLMVEQDGETRLFAASRALFPGVSAPAVAALMQGEPGGKNILSGNQERYLVTWKSVGSLPMKLCQITPMETLDRQLKGYRSMIVAGYSAAMMILIALIVLMYSMIRRPINRMGKAMRLMEGGDFSARIQPTWSAEFQQMFDQFNRMAAHTQRYIQQEYELRLLNSKAELKQMQYQISPHFLYNTYFTLRAMLLDEEYEQAEQLALIMGKYLRYITTSNHEYAALGEEIEHAVAYMQIQQIRFGSRVRADFEECPAEEKKLQVPKLILQPLIENAFEHGVKHQTEESLIRVSFVCTPEAVRILVEDSGRSATDEMIHQVRRRLEAEDEPGGDSVALVNIQKRLRMVYQNGSCLRVSRSSLGGFCSEIYIRKDPQKHVSDDDRG